MAKKCMARREQRRERLAQKYAKRRSELRAIVNNQNTSIEEKLKAQEILQKLPRDSSKCRVSNRCWITGRAKGVYRFVGLSRGMFRIHAMQGDIPGLHKASW